MSTAITKNLVCINMRNGAQIWVEKERAEKLFTLLPSITEHKFIKYEGQVINTADLVGIFDPATMEGITRRKNGQWQCKHLNWHDRGEHCKCLDQEELDRRKKRREAIESCDKCDQDGFIATERGVAYCECWLPFKEPEKPLGAR